MSAFLKVSGLEFSYGEVKVLYGLDLEVSANSISCVMGRNGVGKDALCNLVGLEKPSAGTVIMEGNDLISALLRTGILGDWFAAGSSDLSSPYRGREPFSRLGSRLRESQAIPDEVYDTFPVLHQMRSRRGGDGPRSAAATCHSPSPRNPAQASGLGRTHRGIQPNAYPNRRSDHPSHRGKGHDHPLVEQYADFVRKFVILSRHESRVSSLMANTNWMTTSSYT